MYSFVLKLMSRTKVFYVRNPSMRVFRSQQSMQRGYGIGGLFRGLIRTVKPLMKKGLLSAGRKALNVGANALSDMQDNNVTLKKALQKQIRSTFVPTKKTINRRDPKRKSSSSHTSQKRKVANKLEQITVPNL